MKRNFIKLYRGFTLVELMISVGIFAFMTAFLLAKYGKFDQSLLLTNLAYDVALNIRTAQSYGISVKNADAENTADNFNSSFGIYFNSSAVPTPYNNNKQFIFFADTCVNAIYDYVSSSGCVDVQIKPPLKIKRNSFIKSTCAGSDVSTCLDLNPLSITFKRPDPNAIIKTQTSNITDYAYAEIVLQSSDGSTKKVIIRKTGQIEVK